MICRPFYPQSSVSLKRVKTESTEKYGARNVLADSMDCEKHREECDSCGASLFASQMCEPSCSCFLFLGPSSRASDADSKHWCKSARDGTLHVCEGACEIFPLCVLCIWLLWMFLYWCILMRYTGSFAKVDSDQLAFFNEHYVHVPYPHDGLGFSSTKLCSKNDLL